jgi:hypothetical protein
MANEQTEDSECALSNDKLKEQGHPNGNTANKETASANDDQCTISDIVVNMIAAEPNPKGSIAKMFETSFGLIGAHGSVRKELFISAVKQIEVGLGTELYRSIYDQNCNTLDNVG